MRLTDERGRVAGATQVAGNARRVLRQRHAVHPYAVSADMLTGDHRAARRHAHNILRVRTVKSYAVTAESVDVWRSGDCATVATKRVITLLVGGDEQNFAPHDYLPSNICFTFSRPTLAAPAIGNAKTSGSMSVEYITRQRLSPSGMTSTVPR